MKSKAVNRKKTFLQKVINNRSLIIMLLPAVVYYIIFSYIPMTGIVLAFKSFNYRDGIFRSPWVGFENFRFFFLGGKAFSVTTNTLLYNLAFMVTATTTEIIAAIFLSELRNRYFKRISQSIMFLPYFISWVVVAAFMYNIFNYEFGVLNTFLKSIGKEPVNVYLNVGIWKYILVLANLWKGVGYGSVVYLAAVMGIDREIFEAAEIDGANIFQRIRHVMIPCLVPQIVTMTLLAVGRIFRGNFGMFYQVTGNNPLLYDSTDVIDTYVFRSLMDLQEFGMASAAGLYQSVLCFIIINIVNYLVKSYNKDYALF